MSAPGRHFPHQHTIVERIASAGEAEWSGYLGRHPDASPFHETAWMRAVASVYGHEPHYLTARRGGVIRGVLPLFLVRSRFGGRMLVSVPYGVYGGPLVDDDDDRERLVRSVEQLARELRVNSVDLRIGPADHTTAEAGFAPAGAAGGDAPGWRRIDDYVAFRRGLPATADDVAGWLPRKARAAARRAAERNDLQVSFDPGDWPIVWELYSRSMRRLGSINYPADFFRALLEHSRGGCVVQVVRCAGAPVAGLLTLIHRRTAMPYFVGTDERCNAYGLSNFLYLHAMRRAVELGCTHFDFGRSRRDNAGSYEFKRLHGFEPTPLAYLRWTPPGGRDPGLSPSNPRFRWARRAWPHLPLAVTRPLGAWLSKSIPG